MPFVHSRQSHGDTLPAKDHCALDFRFATHVECLRSIHFFQECLDGTCFHACANENLRTIQGQQLADGFPACQAAACAAAGQYRVKSIFLCIKIGFYGSRYIDTAMQVIPCLSVLTGASCLLVKLPFGVRQPITNRRLGKRSIFHGHLRISSVV